MGDMEEDTARPSVVETGKALFSETLHADVATTVNGGGGAASRGGVGLQTASKSIPSDLAGEYDRVKTFYERNGYLSAPRQSKEATLKRLQAM
jgi:hypothetical protein